MELPKIGRRIWERITINLVQLVHCVTDPYPFGW